MKKEQCHNHEVLRKVYMFIFHPLKALSNLESPCFVQIVGWGNIFPSSVYGWLTTFKTFTCTRSSSPIALGAKYQSHHYEKAILHHGNSKTIGYTSKR